MLLTRQPPSFEWTLLYLNDDMEPGPISEHKGVTEFDAIHVKWRSAELRRSKEFGLVKFVLRQIFKQLIGCNKAYAIQQTRRYLFERSLGTDQYQVDKTREFFSMDQFFTLYPPFERASEAVLEDLDFFCKPERREG